MSNNQRISVPEGFMLVERSIWTEQQVEAATECITRLKGVVGMRDRDLAMSAIDAAQCKAPEIYLADLLPAEKHQGEPIMLTAVAKLVDDGDGGLEASWLLEGGTSELFEGMLLLVAHNAPELCEEDGSAEVYANADAGEVERPSQIALSLQTKLKSVESERDRLRAKLADQENSARELLRVIGMSVQGSAAYNRAVIAFHDSLNADTKPN